MVAKSAKDLKVYKKAYALAMEIFHISKRWPSDEKYSLTDQIRRCSRSVCANLREAWAKRRYRAHFITKLTDSDGEQMETQHWIEAALDCEYIDQRASTLLIEKCLEIGRMLSGMMSKAEMFCGEPSRTLREDSAIYFTQSDNKVTDY